MVDRSRLGRGWLAGRGGFVWVAAVLAAGSVVLSPAAGTSEGFTDTGGAGVHKAAIDALAAQGILSGTQCAPEAFCPGDPIERWVMAVWLVRVIDGVEPPAVQSTRFVDVAAAGEWWLPYVERLAELGVTRGCSHERYCPEESVTRAQMASFLGRAFGLASGPPSVFVDVRDNTHSGNISALAASGITVGCDLSPAYCPGDATTRAQMASFVARALGLVAKPSPPAYILSVRIGSSAPEQVTGPFEVEITFSEEVTGFAADDVRVVNGSVDLLRGSGSTYRAVIVPADEGTVMVRVRQDAARSDEGPGSLVSAPLARTMVSDARVPVPGFDTWDRSSVHFAYLNEFNSVRPDPGYTGDPDGCSAGTTSQAFRDSVVQRVNWYRRIAGVEANTTERTEYSAAAQQAAKMMAAQGDLSHHPGEDWACYTPLGAEAAAKSNLGLGSSGREAITQYMEDSGTNNAKVGHRRWILSPFLREIGTGDDNSHGNTANALYVFQDSYDDRSAVRERRGFVSWPPAGYIPTPIVWPRWSFSLTDADFSSAEVAVSDDSGPLQVEITARESHLYSYPVSAIVWTVHHNQPSALETVGDPCYRITISGVAVAGVAQPPYEYATCLLPPITATG